MKKIGIVILALFISSAALANDGGSKTFLVLFKSKELKALKISVKEIESHFSAFKTKSYGGNSEPAMIIELPSGDLGDCFLGQFVVETKKKIKYRLEEIAFRMVDMTSSKEAKENFLIAYEENSQKKKNEKAAQRP